MQADEYFRQTDQNGSNESEHTENAYFLFCFTLCLMRKSQIIQKSKLNDAILNIVITIDYKEWLHQNFLYLFVWFLIIKQPKLYYESEI